MKKICFCALLLVALTSATIFTYAQAGAPVIKADEILKSDDSFYNYVGLYFFKITRDIVPYDAGLKVISKQTFFEKLSTGSYLPLKLSSADGKLYYQLCKVNSEAGKKRLTYIQSFATIFLDHYNRQGKPFPTFSFTDINGNKYDNTNTKGKTIVLKCWYIGCGRCEEEMPELNAIVAKYKARKDVVFVSLAFDTKPKLQAFLKRKQFNYQVVAGQRPFITQTLHINAFPTHFIINKNGTIVAVVDNPDEIEYALEHKV
ncbi:TlpA family protein disulfide reductase [Mucilaginibacter flavus]|uniref:TlpA family protein disulfide reductase n=1 Tax=Mucilaginibacter flavus TaxID=931504 RepID=UPI0025B3AD90|nr:TlpA disulfide reductase family protein [Mucilaginibacter flavus]MDN3579469.1 TlpA disulfide reductase family protein [Mucilaginibacter flavus]